MESGRGVGRGRSFVWVGRSTPGLVVIVLCVGGDVVCAWGRAVVLVGEAKGWVPLCPFGPDNWAGGWRGGGARGGATPRPGDGITGDRPASPLLVQGELCAALLQLVVLGGCVGVAGTDEGLQATQVPQHLQQNIWFSFLTTVAGNPPDYSGWQSPRLLVHYIKATGG